MSRTGTGLNSWTRTYGAGSAPVARSRARNVRPAPLRDAGNR